MLNTHQSPASWVHSMLIASNIRCATGRGVLYEGAVDAAMKIFRIEGPLAFYLQGSDRALPARRPAHVSHLCVHRAAPASGRL